MINYLCYHRFAGKDLTHNARTKDQRTGHYERAIDLWLQDGQWTIRPGWKLDIKEGVQGPWRTQ